MRWAITTSTRRAERELAERYARAGLREIHGGHSRCATCRLLYRHRRYLRKLGLT